VNDLQQSVCGYVDRELMAAMALDLVNIPTSSAERPGAEYLAGKFAELGMEATFQEVEEDRWNVLLRLRGSGGGRTLLFSGHLDTSALTDDPRQISQHQLAASRDGDWLYGLGMSNMKSAFPAYFEAVAALQHADAQLRGDVLIAGVVGETERGAPHSGMLGRMYRGAAIGSNFLATHGLTADYAIIGEPTALHLAVGQTGWIFARITVTGSSQHTWCKEYGIDPIEKMQKVMDCLRSWEGELKRVHAHPFMDTRLGIGAIEGGYPYKPSRCPPPSCTIYVDLRIPPPFTSIAVKRELWAALDELRTADAELTIDVDFYVTAPGYELAVDNPVVKAMEHSHEAAFGRAIAYAAPSRYCVSSDGASYWNVGIPAITYGPGGVQREGQLAVYGPKGEAVNLDNMVHCAQMYALAALEICA
jgi:acetylornithine deacetylase/succinyl-diaminopimelate desuccinylase-like protein